MSVVTRIVVADGDGLASVRRDLRFSGAEIERATGLTRGVVSAVEGGRLYPYPKFRSLVAGFLASETGESFEAMHERLFPGLELPTELGP